MSRFALPFVRSKIGRTGVAWCAMLAIALTVRAQELEWQGPPPGNGLTGEESMIVRDGADAEVLDEPTGDLPEAVADAGLPYIMQRDGGMFQPGSYLSAPSEPPTTYCPCLTRLGFRHSYTHGRNVGWGVPLVGSSWLNRPFYYGATLGPMWLTNRVIDSVGRDADVMGSLLFGWDWDYYWGSEFQYAYATPELRNTAAPDAPHNGRLISWNYSLMYYPWGDSTIRPYWRLGVGDSKFDFPTDEGLRHDEWLFTSPFGVGLKYPLRRWLAARVEFTDQFSWGGHGVATQHNLTLNFGLECRFGAKRKAYWPWNPSRHLW